MTPQVIIPDITSSCAVTCSALTKEFGQGNAAALVLRGIDLAIPYGNLTLLVGPSGCGKTTLLSVIAGLLTRTSGTLTVLGMDPEALGPTEHVVFRRQYLGFVFQQYNLLPSLTAAENAAVPLLAAGVKRTHALARGVEMLEKLGCGTSAGLLPAQLSGGQQQRVAIARALIHEPQLVLCDEPTAALDAQSGHATMEILARVAVQPGRAVVVVTHDNRVFEFADGIVYMEDGQIKQVKTT
jgi:putative ABC transport system ATP-binding protein